MPNISSCFERRYYPDLPDNLTDNDAAAHYLSAGRRANRIGERLRVVTTYGFKWPGREPSPYGGLCNQWYIHITMLAVLLQLGAEVVRAIADPSRLKPEPAMLKPGS